MTKNNIEIELPGMLRPVCNKICFTKTNIITGTKRIGETALDEVVGKLVSEFTIRVCELTPQRSHCNLRRSIPFCPSYG